MKTEAEHRKDMMGLYYALKEAYYSYVLSVSYADHSMTYRSRSDMRLQLDELESELGISGGSGTPRSRIGVFKKGL